MTEDEKLKITEEVYRQMTLALRMEGIDLLSLDKKTQDLLTIAFQVGVTFWENKEKEMQSLKNGELPF